MAQLHITPFGPLIVPGGSAKSIPQMLQAHVDHILATARRWVQDAFKGAFRPLTDDIFVIVKEDYLSIGEHRLEASWKYASASMLYWVWYVTKMEVTNPFTGSKSIEWKITNPYMVPTAEMVSLATNQHVDYLRGQTKVESTVPTVVDPQAKWKSFLEKCSTATTAGVCYFCDVKSSSILPSGIRSCVHCISRHIYPVLVGE